MNWFAAGAVFIGIALGLDLLQRFAFRQLFYHFKFKQIDMAVKVDAHIYLTVVASVFDRYVHAKRCKVAVKHAGIMTFILGDWVVAVPVVG